MFGYVGGKYSKAIWLRHMAPERDTFDVYLEVFGGGCWFYLQNEEYFLGKEIYYNDYNIFNCNAMMCLVHPDFKKYVKDQKTNDPELFLQYVANLDSLGKDREAVIARMPDFELGWQWIYKMAYSHSGIYSAHSTYKFRNKTDAIIPLLNKINNPKSKHSKMLRKVTRFTCVDFQEVIEEFDGPRTFSYLDPPYWETEDLYSFHEFGREDHERVANVIKSAKATSLLSYYRFPLLEEWFPQDGYDWVERKFAGTAYSKGTKEAPRTKTEVAIAINYRMQHEDLLNF